MQQRSELQVVMFDLQVVMFDRLIKICTCLSNAQAKFKQSVETSAVETSTRMLQPLKGLGDFQVVMLQQPLVDDTTTFGVTSTRGGVFGVTPF